MNSHPNKDACLYSLGNEEKLTSSLISDNFNIYKSHIEMELRTRQNITNLLEQIYSDGIL